MQIKRLLNWLDEHILLLLASFLVAFIPLYPKLPLFEAIPGYIVRVRLEDLLVFFTMVIWAIQVLRKKIAWRTPLTAVVVLYAVVGILSTISAVLITKTVPAEMLHIGKTLLHYFRYLEYFSVLFVMYSAIKSPKHLKIVLWVIAITVLALSIYGVGQRFWYWPVYSTMNREFSKGVRLYLTEHARVQSTFGGHYDLAAYLVITSPLLLAGVYFLKRFWQKLVMLFLFFFSYWLLIVTASRTSYAGYFIAVAIVIVLAAFLKRDTWWKRAAWALRNGLMIALVTFYMLVTFGDSMYERLMQSLEAYPAANTTYHRINDERKRVGEFVAKVVDPNKGFSQAFREWTNPMAEIKPPENGISLADAEVLVTSDTRPTPVTPITPSDVYVNVPVYETVATVSADGTVTQVVVEKDRTYSENAQKYGLSLAIRLDTLWPRALQGFYKNPLLGSGYATLTKESVTQFTEAESTDNNFLRTLGETGALGFITFYGAVVITMYLAWKLYRQSNNDPLVNVFVIAFLAGSVGLLLNAVFIDVFAASKVAFSYWILAGIVLACYALYGQPLRSPIFLNAISTDRARTSAQSSYLPKSKAKLTKKRTVKKKKFKNT